MAPLVDRRAARAWVARWRRVAAAERAELRRAPLEVKVRQLAAMFESARALGWATTDPAEVDAVRRRWQRLRERLGAGPRRRG